MGCLLFTRTLAKTLLLRPRGLMARFASTPYLDRASQGPIWPLLSTSDKPSEAELADDAAAVCAWLGEARARPDEISARCDDACRGAARPRFGAYVDPDKYDLVR